MISYYFFILNMVSDYNNLNTILDYLISKSVLYYYDLEETYYNGNSKDITTINSSIGRIRFTENGYTNFISMYYKGKHYISFDIIIKELENNIS